MDGGKGGEMAQTLYTHMNKRKKNQNVEKKDGWKNMIHKI
jgi:hypothetical protein